MKKNIFSKVLMGGILIGITSLSLFSTRASATVSTHFGEGFDSGTINTQNWTKADGWTNGGFFNCTWRGTNINLLNGKMTLSLNKDLQGSSTKYSGGELRSNSMNTYGLYQANMKPAKNVGVVSSFFTYTGPSDGNPWDEIDIEFLGKDTTKVQFNYFVNGVGGHEFIYNLGFDASKSYHTYSFEWKTNCIIWRVDGKVAHIAYGTMPSHSSKIMMNLWNGKGVDSWLGAYDGKTPVTASYDWVSYDKF